LPVLIACAIDDDAHVRANFDDPQVARFISCVAERPQQAPTRCQIGPDPLNAIGRDGETPLLWLLSRQRISPSTMAELIRMGADPFKGVEPAANYAVRELPIAYLQALISAGVDVNNAWTPGSPERGFDDALIFSAIMSRDYDKVLFLIRRGANVNIRNHMGETPLLFADLNTFDIQILLLESGADPLAKDAVGHGVCWAIENQPLANAPPDAPEADRQEYARYHAQRSRFLSLLRQRGVTCSGLPVGGGGDRSPGGTG
jgi:hypothetical protein